MVRLSRWLLRSPRPGARAARPLLCEFLEARLTPTALPDLAAAALARLDTAGPDGARDGPLAKVGFDLALLARETAAGLAPSNSLLQVAAGYVAVEARPAGNAATLQVALTAVGFVPVAASPALVTGWLPVAAVPAAAGLDALAALRPAYRLAAHAGATTTQGDAAQRSDDVRRFLGLDGTGVNFGVISDSFNVLGGASGDVVSGDLPGPGNPNGRLIPVNVLSEGSPGGRDEGRAMLQVVHDVAPGAALLFASAGVSQLQLAASIRALANNGAHVIVDDVTFPAEPMFQDGVVAQAVDQVAAAGVAYFSAAGNLGRQSYQAAYSPGSNLGTAGLGIVLNSPDFFAHDFDAGPGVNYFQTVSLPAGRTTFSFQWADRYASAGGAGAATDMDIAVFTDGGVYLGTLGGYTTNTGGDPVEVFEIDAGPTGGRFQLALGKFSGPDPALVKYVAFGDGVVIEDYATDSATIFGHANAAGAAAVGAARYADTPRFGTDPPVAREFTGRGGTPVLFDAAGAPTADPSRPAPRFVAPDGGNTTFFGTDDDDADAFPNFVGTSAAAPHAAGAAALMLQANPALAPADLFAALAATARDVGPAGFDVDTGAGLIQALPAVLAVGGPFDVVLGGTDGDDTFVVRRDTSGTDVEFFHNGDLVFRIPAAKLGRVTADGKGGSDTLTADYANGAPVSSAGLAFAGGESAGDDDRLAVVNYTAETVIVDHDGPERGTVQIGGGGLISFDQIEPLLLDGTAADLFVNLPITTNADAAVGDDTGPGERAGFSAVSGSTFEYTRFRNPTRGLFVALGGGGDTIALRPMDAGFAAGVTVTGGMGTDRVVVAGGAGDDAVLYTPTGAEAGTIDLTRGAATSRFTLADIEALTADGDAHAAADAVTVFAPRATVAFAADGGVVTPASAAGDGWLALAYRNFEAAAVAATFVTVLAGLSDDTVDVAADGTVLVTDSGGAVGAARVTAAVLTVDGRGGADQFTIAGNHPFIGGVIADGGLAGAGPNALVVVGSDGDVAFDPVVGRVTEAGHGGIVYRNFGPLAIDAGAAGIAVAGGEGTSAARLTGPNTATFRATTGAMVEMTAAVVTVTAADLETSSVTVSAETLAGTVAVAAGRVTFDGFLPVQAGSGVDALVVVGGAGDDTFTVTPGPIPVGVDGGPHGSGDTLHFVGSVSGRPVPGNGTIASTPTVTYSDIEFVTLGDVPDAQADSPFGVEDRPLTIPVLANDAGLGDGPLKLTIEGGPAFGTAVVVGDVVVYTPAPGYNTLAGAADTFTYRVEDANGEFSVGTITVRITAVNDLPIAFTGAVTLEAGGTAAVVLTGDDGDVNATQSLTYRIVTPPAHGTLFGFDPATGHVTYTPFPGFSGDDAIVFAVTDDVSAGGPALTSSPATVSIRVTPLNRPPTAVADAFTMRGNGTLSLPGAMGVRANDGDPDGDRLFVSLVSGPAHGRLTLNGDGGFTYTPASGYSGADHFVYTVTDGRGGSATATASLTVFPAERRYIATGAGAGGGPHVKVFDAYTGAEVFSFFAYAADYRGGVKVAVGDVNGDGVPDIVTAPGPGGGPHIRVFSGIDLAPLANFFAFDPNFRSGANVAVGDLDADGVAEIVAGAAPGGGSHVRTFDVRGGLARQFSGPLGSFFAFDDGFTGGVSVAVGDYDGVGGGEIIVGAASLFPQVRVFAATGLIMADFFAFDVANVGLTIAAGDIDGDGRADVVVGPGDGGGPVVRVFRGGTGELIGASAAFDPTLRGGISVAVADRTRDGRAEVVAAPTEQARAVQILDPTADKLLDLFNAYGGDFPGGVYVGAG